MKYYKYWEFGDSYDTFDTNFNKLIPHHPMSALLTLSTIWFFTPVLYLLFSSKRNLYTSHTPFSLVECLLPISAYKTYKTITHYATKPCIFTFLPPTPWNNIYYLPRTHISQEPWAQELHHKTPVAYPYQIIPPD